jgi:ADP-ribosylglycohydrolase/protein-tyrosine phosphatase
VLIKTSQDYPLRIDTLDVSSGRLGLTFCPGKKQPDWENAYWERDLEADLARIRDWGAAAVVSAIQEHELDELGVPDLGDAVEALAIDWHHIPIRDVDIPGPDAEALWFYTGTRLKRMLLEGQGVVVHCKGGLGRTGTLGARLLVELGWQPADAIARVRAARPGTVETREQENHVLRLKPGGRPEKEVTIDERILGCLLGGAVGDAFGFCVEFFRWPDIQREYGPAGLQEPVFHADQLVVSDDTQMTLFTAEGLLRATARREDRGIASTPAVVWNAYQRWRSTQDLPAETFGDDGWLVQEETLRHQRAPGNTCLGALDRPLPAASTRAPNNSKGCGGVMRIAPVGLIHRRAGDREVFDMACELAWLTHGHPSGFLSAGAMAAIIGALMEGHEIEDAAGNALELLKNHDGAGETIGRIDQALALAGAGSAAGQRIPAALGEGWVGEEALGIGLYAALVGGSFSDVIRLAANHDGDSDSTAAIAAQIHGARHGIADLPNAWIRRLDVLEPLLFLAHDLAALADEDRQPLRRYPPN